VSTFAVESVPLVRATPLALKPEPETARAPRPAGEHEARRIAHARPAPAVGLLQRACSCGGIPGPDGECAECKAKRLQREAAISVGGVPLEDRDPGLEIAINDGPRDAGPADAGPAKKPAPAPACPTSIKVAEIIPVAISDAQVGAGIRTGWGAVTRMEVSGGSKTNWDGTKIHENLAAGSNDCDKDPACTNAGGEGGDSGSTFTVGEGQSAFKHPDLGELFPDMPAKQNCFYDVHMMGGSMDWCAARGSCTRTCKQTYDCGGTAFGSSFTIKYAYSKVTRKDKAGKDVAVCTARFSKA
jgi:hypothetical protein